MFCKIKTRLFYFVLAAVICGGNSYADNTNYILTARQNDLLKNMDRISDMAANVNTTAFKSEKDIFTERKKTTSKNERLSFPAIGNTVRDNAQGGMQTTGRQLDIAINGPGYFMVKTPYGNMFTRNGSLMVNNDGTLVTHDGYAISGAGGEQITLTETDVEVSIKEDGMVKVGVEERGQIGLFVFDDEALVERVGKGLFRTGQFPKLAEKSVIAQGMLETSNVNSVTAMTNLVEVSRNVENIIKVAASHNDMQVNMIRKMSQ